LKFTLPYDKSEILVVKDLDGLFIVNCCNGIEVSIQDRRSTNELITKSYTEDKEKFE